MYLLKRNVKIFARFRCFHILLWLHLPLYIYIQSYNNYILNISYTSFENISSNYDNCTNYQNPLLINYSSICSNISKYDKVKMNTSANHSLSIKSASFERCFLYNQKSVIKSMEFTHKEKQGSPFNLQIIQGINHQNNNQENIWLPYNSSPLRINNSINIIHNINNNKTIRGLSQKLFHHNELQTQILQLISIYQKWQGIIKLI